MGGLLSKPKSIQAPKPKPAPPIPTVDTDEVGARARKTRPLGFRETFLTGDLIPSQEELKKKKLGGGR